MCNKADQDQSIIQNNIKSSNDLPIDRNSILATEQISDLPPRFKNEVVFDLSLTSLKNPDMSTDEFFENGRSAKLALEAFKPENSAQLILASQILSNHKMHQKMLMYATNEQRIDQTQTYINLAMKLANVINQQLQLMERLKGERQQKVVIEHVSINGGQAVVGTINTTPTTPETKK